MGKISEDEVPVWGSCCHWRRVVAAAHLYLTDAWGLMSLGFLVGLSLWHWVVVQQNVIRRSADLCMAPSDVSVCEQAPV